MDRLARLRPVRMPDELRCDEDICRMRVRFFFRLCTLVARLMNAKPSPRQKLKAVVWLNRLIQITNT